MTTPRRTVLLALAAGVSALSAQQPPAKQNPPKIVFVCEHGAAKSVSAAAEMRRLAKEKGLLLRIESRGTVPDAEIAAGVRQRLKADGLDAGASKPVKVSAQDLEGAIRIVSFGPNLESLAPIGTKVLDWSATPSPSQDYATARNYIVKQLESLLDGLPK